jgi:hypothetical protein
MGSLDLRETGWGEVWSGFSWLSLGKRGGPFWKRRWTFGFWRHVVSCLRHRIMMLCTDQLCLKDYKSSGIWRRDDSEMSTVSVIIVALMIEAVRTSIKSVYFKETTQRYIP